MREEMMTEILNELSSSSGDIEAAALVSTDGLMMASVLPTSLDEDRVGAMIAAMLTLGDRTAQELSRGSLDQVMVKGDAGYVLMTHAGTDSVLAVLAKASAKLGLVFLDAKRAAESLGKVV